MRAAITTQNFPNDNANAATAFFVRTYTYTYPVHKPH